MPKPPKTRQERDPTALAMRAAQMRAEAASGKRVGEIAKDFGVERHTVTRALNTEETKAAIKEAEGRLAALINKSINALEEAIEQRADIGTAARTAAQVLKNFRILRDAPLEIEGKHALFIIEKLDGTQVIMGAKAEGEDDGN